jgi:glycosyltransferase involved in cell wall biosynthesis
MANSNVSHEDGCHSVSVVVPVFNAEATLVELCSRIAAVLEGLSTDFEIVLVNDGSSDSSWRVISGLAEQNTFVTGISLIRNYGQHNALLAGIRKAEKDVIVTMDDDLQHPPEEIPRLLEKLSGGYDLVYGKPAARNHSLWRNICSWMLKLVLKTVMGSEASGNSSAFRAFNSVLRRGFEKFSDASLSIDVLLSWVSAGTTHVMVEHHPRRDGKSGYSFGKLSLLAFDLLTGYSILPLRIASGAGLTTALAGLVIFLYVVIRRLAEPNYVPGFAFLASEIALFAGLQLFAIGVIGEYVARLHFRTMGKPTYVVRDEVGKNVLSK